MNKPNWREIMNGHLNSHFAALDATEELRNAIKTRKERAADAKAAKRNKKRQAMQRKAPMAVVLRSTSLLHPDELRREFLKEVGLMQAEMQAKALRNAHGKQQ